MGNDLGEIRPFFRFVQIIVYIFFKIFYRLSIEGIENIPDSVGVIIAPNHASWLDPPMVGCVMPREISFFAKKELFSIPVVGDFIKYTKGIPVDRKGYTAGAMKELVKNLKSGRAVCIFPEGTRTRTGEFLEPKKGIGMVAVMADAAIVPCWIQGSFKMKPFISKVTLHFMPPFKPEEIKAQNEKDHYLLVSERIICDISQLLYKKHMAVLNKAKSNI